MYNAYGSNDGEGGAGTTNLHLDMADAVNIMIYASYLDNLPIEQQEQLLYKKSQPLDDNRENDSSGTSRTTYSITATIAANGSNQPTPVENRARYPVDNRYEFTERPPGIAAAAVWDIFPLADLPKLRAFLATIARERNIPIDDPVHDQTFYLDHGMRERLLREYGVRGWRIFQNPGDAVFVPAGCAHQVCNYASCIKVAMDFVSPENISRCAQLTQEFRRLGENHRRKQDILQLNTILYSTWQECEALLTQRKKVFSSKNVHAALPGNRSRKRVRNDPVESPKTTNKKSQTI
jgi:lysine-specific demethylase 3